MHEKWGGGTLNDFDIKMMVESNAIDFLQILAAVLDLLANSLLANHHSPLWIELGKIGSH